MILRYSVFDNFWAGDTVIWVNFARYSVITPIWETKNRDFMNIVTGALVSCNEINGN